MAAARREFRARRKESRLARAMEVLGVPEPAPTVAMSAGHPKSRRLGPRSGCCGDSARALLAPKAVGDLKLDAPGVVAVSAPVLEGVDGSAGVGFADVSLSASTCTCRGVISPPKCDKCLARSHRQPR